MSFIAALEQSKADQGSYMAQVLFTPVTSSSLALEHLKRIPCEQKTFQYFITAAHLAFKVRLRDISFICIFGEPLTYVQKGAKLILGQVLKQIVLSPMDWTLHQNKTNLLTILR